MFSVIEQRSLEREISRVRHELEMTEKKTAELEQRVTLKQQQNRRTFSFLFSSKIRMKQLNLTSND